jgi:tricarballylate dehydrogenase
VRKLGLIPPSYDKATGAQADTLRELAENLGIDPDGLTATVKEFNDAVPHDAHADPNPYHTDGVHTRGLATPKSNFAMTIAEPPFEGYAVRCGITFTFGGVKIDPQTGQVQHVAHRPIPGLYAAGEMVGGLWYWNYPSGSGMMAGATFGRRAGYAAAESARHA